MRNSKGRFTKGNTFSKKGCKCPSCGCSLRVYSHIVLADKIQNNRLKIGINDTSNQQSDGVID